MRVRRQHRTGGRAAVDLAVAEFGRLDAIVANAGIIHDDPLPDWPTERFEALLRHHLLAAFHVVRPGFAVMRDAGYGRLVFVSSAAGVFGQPGLTGYATAKTGMLGLMNVAALEGAAYGIRANAIMPMGDTRMAMALIGEAGRTADARAFLETLRLDQVAPVVAYLASESCTLTHRVLSAFRGRVAALQIGVTGGWFAPTVPSTPRTSRPISTVSSIRRSYSCLAASLTKWSMPLRRLLSSPRQVRDRAAAGRAVLRHGAQRRQLDVNP